MRKLEYYVGVSIDGYISGPNDDISGFTSQGNGIDKYLSDLKDYDTVIMGRKTYEFGYNYGLKPGQLAYPHMKHYVFSEGLELEDKDENLITSKLDLGLIDTLKKEEGSNIYLCGGGEFAKWLLENKKIDTVRIKLNPFLQGDGVKLFSKTTSVYKLRLRDSETYDDGLLIITYDVMY